MLVQLRVVLLGLEVEARRQLGELTPDEEWLNSRCQRRPWCQQPVARCLRWPAPPAARCRRVGLGLPK